MFLKNLFKKKSKYPEIAKYHEDDLVTFRYRGDLSFGYVYDAKLDDDGKVSYTIQLGGQCPALLYDFKEENIIGLKK
ncbi:MAG: hypothetical protein E7676_06120 [Ruminococcaceae bacterium]|nr:hypothetical protein [Oscillospiraceae bacterium]